MRYDCASPSVAHWITRLANKVGLTASEFIAAVQTTAEQIAALSPATPDDEPALDEASSSAESEPEPRNDLQTSPVQAPVPQLAPPEPPPAPEPETADAAAERERLYREILGMDEPKRRRPWRRSG